MNVTKKLKENEGRNKGITLIALVITIVRNCYCVAMVSKNKKEVKNK